MKVFGGEFPRGPNLARWVGFFCAVLALMIALDPGWDRLGSELEEVTTRSGAAKTTVYGVTYGLATLGLVLLLTARRRWVRVTAGVLALGGSGVQVVSRRLNGEGFGLWEARMYFNEADQAGDALKAFGADVAVAAGYAVVTVLVLVGLRRWLRLTTGVPVVVALVLGIAPMGVILAWTEGEIGSYPPPLKVPVVAVMANLPTEVVSDRRAPLLRPTESGPFRHVILVVDESVRGDFLGINGGPPTTPWLVGLGPQIVNFGVCCAASNSSAPSNMILQSGIRPAGLLQDATEALRMPSVFQYARAAGFQNVFLGGQVLKQWYYGSPYDLDYFDVLIQPRDLGDVPRWDVDQRLIQELLPRLRSGDRTFSYVLKLGAHFRYEDKRPPEFWPGDQTLFPTEPDGDRRELLDQYARTVSWATDGFLRALFLGLEGEDVVVVYTSDHGQSLMEGGISATHGVKEAPPSTQANVPLMLWAGRPEGRRWLRQRFGSAADAHRDRASHFQVFPTVLELLGYEPTGVSAAYGPGLADPPPFPREFLSGDPFKPGVRRMNRFDL